MLLFFITFPRPSLISPGPLLLHLGDSRLPPPPSSSSSSVLPHPSSSLSSRPSLLPFRSFILVPRRSLLASSSSIFDPDLSLFDPLTRSGHFRHQITCQFEQTSWTVVHGSALVSYNAGISACEKGEQWQRALALISEMREAKLETDVIISAVLGPARAGKVRVSTLFSGPQQQLRRSRGSQDCP